MMGKQYARLELICSNNSNLASKYSKEWFSVKHVMLPTYSLTLK